MMETGTQPTAEPQLKKRGRPTNEALAEKKREVLALAKRRPNASQRTIAAEIGVNRATVAEVLAKYKINHDELEGYKDNQVNVILGIQSRIAKHITDADIKNANLVSKATAFGIFFDKYRTASGQSNVNLASIISIATKAEAAQDDVSIDGKE